MLNKKKRNLELTGAIFSIVLGAFGLLGVLVLSMSTNLIKEYPQFADLDLNFINVILVCFNTLLRSYYCFGIFIM